MKRKSLPTGRDFLFVEGYGNENPGAFQSPRPLRGATAGPPLRWARRRHFNPRAPCGARLFCRGRRTTWRFCHFNPRAPCGARRISISRLIKASYFNPRAPCGARRVLLVCVMVLLYFNPRAPCGARLSMSLKGDCRIIFQPTRPLRGATSMTLPLLVLILISTHAPLAGRDRMLDQSDAFDNYFNPRAPCGARLACLPFDTAAKDFNPRAPCGARRSLFFSMIRR